MFTGNPFGKTSLSREEIATASEIKYMELNMESSALEMKQ